MDENEQMSKAVSAVNKGLLSQRKAAHQFGVKLMTLNDLINGRHGPSKGARTKLGTTVENLLVTLFIFMSDIGFSLCRSEMLFVVNNYLIESEQFDIFKDCEPSKTWYYSFMNRYS